MGNQVGLVPAHMEGAYLWLSVPSCLQTQISWPNIPSWQYSQTELVVSASGRYGLCVYLWCGIYVTVVFFFFKSTFPITPWVAHGKEEVFQSIDFHTMPGTVLDNQSIGRVLISNLSMTPENWVSKDDHKRVTKWVQVYPTVFKAHFWCIFL